MVEPDKSLLEEIGACIAKVKVFHESHNRRIANFIKRSRKGRQGLERLAEFGVPIAEDFQALYWNYNGTNQRSSMSMWAAAVFLDFEWYPWDSIIISTEESFARSDLPVTDRLLAFRGDQGLDLDTAPFLASEGATPLVVSIAPLSEKTFIAFDSTIAFLRSVCGAQDAGIIWFEEDKASYKLDEFWDVAKEFNTRAEYWPLMLQDKLDWEEIEYDEDDLTIEPAVARIISKALKGGPD
ncbi:hypothetical protein RXV86_05555 [Alisedimentitalea sp. MJ-SS2]|uniref:hypothetical protein n=1 Tax=Aliisedimentitalea sp. MJ-SS2 TaxID=3049795 RepID=UPI00290C24D3|nr:hypothetical protein [Alisedimentitalea sp. MJ-SS2]MDU8926841.1 hypothetical protein [Alisedimentitalea sp. MJ-SS2]